MKISPFLLSLLFVLPLHGNAQIKLKAQDEPLTVLLQKLQAQYGLQYSYKANMGQSCRISLEAEFADIDEALKTLLATCHLDFYKQSTVYIIRKKPSPPPSICEFKGRLIDSETAEGLANVVIQYGSKGTLSDENGYFKIVYPASQARLQFSHINYQNLDTLLSPQQAYILGMEAQDIALDEVVIEERLARESGQEEYAIFEAIRTGELKAGLYQSLGELAQNQPSLPWLVDADPKASFRIKKILFDSSVHLRMPYEQSQAIQKLEGFSDGQNVYLNLSDKNWYRRGSEFARLYPVGPYLYYEDWEYDVVLEFSTLERYVFDVSTGEVQYLSKRMIAELLSSDPKLSDTFKKDWMKRDRLDEYLFLYYDTPHPSDSL
ncbi:MAG: carboxypeptidase-like regulatory domain-containing protein [Bacteroidota bacterium]